MTKMREAEVDPHHHHQDNKNLQIQNRIKQKLENSPQKDQLPLWEK